MAMRLACNGEQSNAKLSPPQIHFNMIAFTGLKTALDLGIPDIMHNHGGPMTLSELIKALPGLNKSKAQCIPRLMRILVHSGFLVTLKINPQCARDEDADAEAEEEGYSLGPYMLGDIGMIDMVILTAGLHMGEWFRNDDPTPVHTAYGMSFWDYTGQNPKLNELFNKFMARKSEDISKVVARECLGAFEGLNSVVDVGGGTGTLAKAIADAFPFMNCINFDLPQVVAGLEGTKNLTHVEGDMFLAIPQANAVILKIVLHDWSDVECVKILKRCKEAIPSREKGGRLMIIEIVMVEMEKNDDDTNKLKGRQIMSDIGMMILTTGKERTEKEWAKLFADAGFSDYKLTPLPDLKSMDLGVGYHLIEVYP